MEPERVNEMPKIFDFSPALVRERVSAITVAALGYNARSLADRLLLDLLRSIGANRCQDVAECARLAAATDEIDFDRWYG